MPTGTNSPSTKRRDSNNDGSSSPSSPRQSKIHTRKKKIKDISLKTAVVSTLSSHPLSPSPSPSYDTDNANSIVAESISSSDNNHACPMIREQPSEEATTIVSPLDSPCRELKNVCLTIVSKPQIITRNPPLSSSPSNKNVLCLPAKWQWFPRYPRQSRYERTNDGDADTPPPNNLLALAYYYRRLRRYVGRTRHSLTNSPTWQRHVARRLRDVSTRCLFYCPLGWSFCCVTTGNTNAAAAAPPLPRRRRRGGVGDSATEDGGEGNRNESHGAGGDGEEEEERQSSGGMGAVSASLRNQNNDRLLARLRRDATMVHEETRDLSSSSGGGANILGRFVIFDWGSADITDRDELIPTSDRGENENPCSHRCHYHVLPFPPVSQAAASALTHLSTTAAVASSPSSARISKVTVCIGNMVFYQHFESNHEETLYGELRLLYGNYLAQWDAKTKVTVKSMIRLKDLVQRAHTCRDREDDEPLGDNVEKVMSFSNECQDIIEQIKLIVDGMLTKEHSIKQLEKALKAAWRNLIKERERTGKTYTPGVLCEQHKHGNEDEHQQLKEEEGKEEEDVSKTDSGTVYTTSPRTFKTETISPAPLHYAPILEQLANALHWLYNGLTRTDNISTKQKSKPEVAAMKTPDPFKLNKQLASLTRSLLNNNSSRNSPRYKLKLSSVADLLPTTDTSRNYDDMREQLRRKRISSEEYFVKVLINGHVVDNARTTKGKLTWPHYHVHFKERFTCHMVSELRSVSVRVYRRARMAGLLPDQLLCENYIAIQDAQVCDAKTHDPNLAWYQFATSRDHRNTLRGAILVGVAYEKLRKGHGNASITDTMAHGERYKVLHCEHSDEVNEIVEESWWNMQKPFLRTAMGEIMLAFKIPGTHNTFINKQYMTEPLRHQLIRMREQNSGQQQVSVPSPIPLDEVVIRNDSTYQSLLQHKRAATKNRLIQQIVNVAARQRTTVERQYISELIERIQKNNSILQEKISSFKGRIHQQSQVIREFEMPPNDDHSLLDAFLKWLFPPPKRALQPRSNCMEQRHIRTSSMSTSIKRCHLLVTIVGAKNVPWRCPDDSHHRNNINMSSPQRGRLSRDRAVKDLSSTTTTSQEQQINETNVQTFVQISFQNCTKRTKTVAGPSPKWKQTIEFPVEMPESAHDHYDQASLPSPAILSQIRESINITLFDSVEVDFTANNAMGGYYETENTIVTNRVYLGHTSVPFSTVQAHGQISGTFEVETPPFCHGYVKKRVASNPNAIDRTDANFTDRSSAKPHYQQQTKNDNNSNSSSSSKSDYEESVTGASGPSIQQLTHASESNTYITMIFTLQPIFQVHSATTVKQQQLDIITKRNKEQHALLAYANCWLKQTSKELSSSSRHHRNQQKKKTPLRIFVPDGNGHEWLITRFLKPQVPPPGVSSIPAAVHFVSHLTNLKEWPAIASQYHNDCVVAANSTIEELFWSTNQQFLNVAAGTMADHAVLLANYFLYLSETFPETCAAQVFLAFGWSLPEGRHSVYVARRRRDATASSPEPSSSSGNDEDDGDIVFWNAVTGRGFSKRDDRLPLQTVVYLADQDNIYVNIQKSPTPRQTDFSNIHNQLRWKPFFSHPANPAPHPPLPSVQEPKLTYDYGGDASPSRQPASINIGAELQDELFDVIKSHIRQWRVMLVSKEVGASTTPATAPTTTSFQTYASHRLTFFLEQLESFHRNNGRLSIPTTATTTSHDPTRTCLPSLTTPLSSVLRGRRRMAVALVLRFSFTNLDDAIAQVKDTRLHEYTHPGVEFVLGVKVFTYGGERRNVLGVWIFLGVVVPPVT